VAPMDIEDAAALVLTHKEIERDLLRPKAAGST
jgi:hypothetical protein